MRKLINIIIAVTAAAMLVCCRQNATPRWDDSHNPMISMMAVTGSPDRDAIRHKLLAMKEAGMEQFLIYPRSGLEIEYMSADWMRLCRDCIELADSLGMRVWLYDEFNWPSGNCKGQVTADGHENLYPKVLVFERDGGWKHRVLLDRNWADLLDPDAACRFIELTHERYYKEFGQYFGNVIPAIFTDEVVAYNSSPKYIAELQLKAWNGDCFGLAWYDGLEADYAAESSGRDLYADVEAYLDGATVPELWSAYYTVCGNRLRTNYLGRISAWCEEHGVKLTGHLMYEKLYKGVRCNGNCLKALSVFGIPGFDEANFDIDLYAREMEISGLALVHYASRGRKDALCEMYSVGPADVPLSLQRQLMWMCAAYGVNNYLVAVDAMDARGNKEKGDWYFSSGCTQPWYGYYRELGQEARRAASFARRSFFPDVYLRVPTRWFMSMDKTPAFEEQGKRYLRFLEELVARQVQFALLDEGEEPGFRLGSEGGIRTDGREATVAAFGPEGFSVEGEHRYFEGCGEFVEHLDALAPRRVVVYEADGTEADDLMVRCFDDGSMIIVDVTDKDDTDRLLTVCTPEGSGTVRILGHGCFAGTLADMNASAAAGAGALFPDSVKVSLNVCNLARCMFMKDSPRFEFTLTEPLEGIRMIVRTDVDGLQASMDGKIIVATEPAAGLQEGFRQLYRSSEPFALDAGRHMVEFRSADGVVTDLRFLPGGFLAGEFEYDRENAVIRPWRGCYPTHGSTQFSSADVMPDYAGTYEIETEVTLPAGCAQLCLDANLACVELLLDGRPLGRRAWGPYEWNVPAGLQEGSHRLCLRVSTSINPMFGKISRLDSDQPYVNWLRIKPGYHGDKTTTGMKGLGFSRR